MCHLDRSTTETSVSDSESRCPAIVSSRINLSLRPRRCVRPPKIFLMARHGTTCCLGRAGWRRHLSSLRTRCLSGRAGTSFGAVERACPFSRKLRSESWPHSSMPGPVQTLALFDSRIPPATAGLVPAPSARERPRGTIYPPRKRCPFKKAARGTTHRSGADGAFEIACR